MNENRTEVDGHNNDGAQASAVNGETVDETASGSELQILRDSIRMFVRERDWEQFNSPKNLATALCVEAGELLEPFQWLKTGDLNELGDKKIKHVQQEMADVLIYLISLADRLETDLVEAVRAKMEINRLKYPAEMVRGDPRKYTDYS
jgi:NTP pyrophosphatase (non-canonical NTP hydrolase)